LVFSRNKKSIHKKYKEEFTADKGAKGTRGKRGAVNQEEEAQGVKRVVRSDYIFLGAEVIKTRWNTIYQDFVWLERKARYPKIYIRGLLASCKNVVSKTRVLKNSFTNFSRGKANKFYRQTGP